MKEPAGPWCGERTRGEGKPRKLFFFSSLLHSGTASGSARLSQGHGERGPVPSPTPQRRGPLPAEMPEGHQDPLSIRQDIARRKGSAGGVCRRRRGPGSVLEWRQLCRSRPCMGSSLSPSVRCHHRSGTALLEVSISGLCVMRPGTGLDGLSESGQGMANLSVPSPWDSCPQVTPLCTTKTLPRYLMKAHFSFP